MAGDRRNPFSAVRAFQDYAHDVLCPVYHEALGKIKYNQKYGIHAAAAAASPISDLRPARHVYQYRCRNGFLRGMVCGGTEL